MDRRIHPRFWTSPRVMCVSRDARLLLIGLFSRVSEYGVAFECSSSEMRALIFPSDPLSSGDVDELMRELIRARLVEVELAGEEWVGGILTATADLAGQNAVLRG